MNGVPASGEIRPNPVNVAFNAKTSYATSFINHDLNAKGKRMPTVY